MSDWKEYLQADELLWLDTTPAMDRILQRVAHERKVTEMMAPVWQADFHMRNPQPQPGTAEFKRIQEVAAKMAVRMKAEPDPCAELPHDWRLLPEGTREEPTYQCTRCKSSSAAHQFPVPPP